MARTFLASFFFMVTSRRFCVSCSRLTFSGSESLSTTPMTNERYLGSRPLYSSPSPAMKESVMNTRRM